MSRNLRSLATVGLAALTMLSASTVLTPPAAAQPATSFAPTLQPVTETVVHGVCHGGGRIVLTAEKTDDDHYVMTATTRGLPEGSRWRGGFSSASNEIWEDSVNVPFHAMADDGGWTVSKTVPVFEAPYFDVVAFGPGPIRVDAPHLCSVLASPAHPFAGVTACRQDIQMAMVAVQRKDIGVVVRWLVIGPRPGSTWAVELSAETDGEGTSSASTVIANKRGVLRGKEVVEDMTDPKLKLTVRSLHGQRCTLSMLRLRAEPITNPSVVQQSHSAPLTQTATIRSQLTSQQRLLDRLR